MIKMHYPAKGDLPETSGEMCVQRKPVLVYTKSLGWTQAIRRQVGKGKFEWVCSSYDGNTRFFDDEITAWTELPEPELVRWGSCRCRHPKSNDLFSPPTEEEMESSREGKNKRDD